MHLLLLHKKFCKTSQIYTTNLQNQCLVYNIPQYECQNSIYYPRENYNRYLSALNLPIRRDQECFTNQCIIEVTKRPLQIYLKYNPLISGSLNSGINLNSVSNQNLISNVSGLSQSLVNSPMNPNTIVKNLYVTKTIDTFDSSEHDSTPIGKNKRRKKNKQQSSSSCDQKPKRKEKIVKDSCSKSDCDEKSKDKRLKLKTVTETEKVTKTVYSPQPEDMKTIDIVKPDKPDKPDKLETNKPEIKPKEPPSNGIKTITKTIEPEEQETVIISVSPPIPEVKTITLPPVTKTIEKASTKHKDASDDEKHLSCSDLESSHPSKKKSRKRRQKKYKKRRLNKPIEEDSCPEPIVKTITVTKNDSLPILPQQTNDLPLPPFSIQPPTYEHPSQPMTAISPGIPTSVVPETLTQKNEPEIIQETEPVTLIRYETQTVTNEVPLTLYREFTTTVEKEKPIINYSVLTITESETVFKTKTITDTLEDQTDPAESVHKTVSADFQRALKNIKRKLKIPRAPSKKNRQHDNVSTFTSELEDQIPPKTVYIQEECSTCESKDDKEELKNEKMRKKEKMKKEKMKKIEDNEEEQTAKIPLPKNAPSDPQQLEALKPFFTKFLEQLSLQKIKEKEVAESKPERTEIKDNKETKTINLPPQTIINHSPKQASTRRIIALKKIGSISCIPECLIPDTNECKPDCEPQYMNNTSTGHMKNKKVRTVINTVYKKTSTNTLKTVS